MKQRSGWSLNSFGLTLLLLLGCVTANAQQLKSAATVSLNYGFVSPNTREGLRLEDAIRGMNSAAESNLLTRAKNLGCVVKQRITATRAVGSWSDGAEHSILIRAKTDETTIRYLMSRLGRDANQKAVIYFHPQSSGQARIYTIRPSRRFRSFPAVAQQLDRSGIVFRTLVFTRPQPIIYIVDTDGTLTRRVKVAAQRLRARINSQTGNASFIGDDSSREKGQALFAQEINEYESKHPQLPPPCEVK